MGYPEELEVLVRAHETVQVLKHLVYAHRHLYGTQTECGYALQRNGGDDAQGAQADAGGTEDIRRGIG